MQSKERADKLNHVLQNARKVAEIRGVLGCTGWLTESRGFLR